MIQAKTLKVLKVRVKTPDPQILHRSMIDELEMPIWMF